MIALFLLPLLVGFDGDTPSEPVVDTLLSDGVSTLVRYDLGRVVPRLDGGSGWSESLVPGLALPYGEGEWVDPVGGLYEPLPPEVVLDVVSRVLGDAMLERGRMISLEGDSSLLVLAPDSVQERVAKVLDTLGRALSSTDTIRVDVLSFTDNGSEGPIPGSSVLDAEEADRLISERVAKGAEYHSYSFDLIPGRTTAMRQGRDVSMLVDYDVEIAQSAGIYDPIIATYRDGSSFFLHGVRRGNATALSFLMSETTALVAPHDRPLSFRVGIGSLKGGGYAFFDGPQTVETAELFSRTAAFTTLLPDDKAVSFSSVFTRGGEQMREVCLLRREGGTSSPFYKASFGSITLMLVNSEVFSNPGFAFSGEKQPYERGDHPVMTAHFQPNPATFLFDWLKYRFSVWRRMGPWAVVVTDPAWDNQALGDLERLCASLKDGDEFATFQADLAAPDGTSFAGWTLPVLQGTRFGAVLGRTTVALVDYDVEVAQSAATPDPVIRSLFDGLMFQGKVLPGPRSVMEVSGWGRRLVLPIEQARQGGADQSSMDLPVDRVSMDRASFSDRVVTRRGEEAVLGASTSKSQRGSGLALHLRVQ